MTFEEEEVYGITVPGIGKIRQSMWDVTNFERMQPRLAVAIESFLVELSI